MKLTNCKAAWSPAAAPMYFTFLILLYYNNYYIYIYKKYNNVIIYNVQYIYISYTALLQVHFMAADTLHVSGHRDTNPTQAPPIVSCALSKENNQHQRLISDRPIPF